MTTWLNALRNLHTRATAAVLVTVAGSQGSTPRKAGARMVFSLQEQFDTIGGGHLEWRAAQIARAMLGGGDSLNAQRRLERIALGPSLGQCCGGVVTLAFERLPATPAALAQLQQLEQHWQQGQALWRAVPLDALSAVVLLEPNGKPCSDSQPAALPDNLALPADGNTQVISDRHGQRWLLDCCRAQRPQVVLFGAGHVGAAIVRLLTTLPCRVIWVDEREDMFPAGLPAQVSVEATDVPNAVVDLAEPGAYFLVMTHSHALDQQLTERILKRADIGWFGLIGSHTKRKQFEHRLQDRGFTPQQLDRMTCPIGIPGIYGKEPASIALAVVAQLVQLWELRASQTQTPQTQMPQTHTPRRRPDALLATQVLDGRH